MVQASGVPAALQRAFGRGSGLVIGCFLGAPSEAGAEPPRVEMTAPEGCPNAEELGAAVMDLVARDFDPTGMRLDITRAADDWSAVLSLPEGERQLQGESCAALVDAAAVIVALSLERGRETPAAPAPTQVAPPAAAPATQAAARVAPPLMESSSEGSPEGVRRPTALRVMLHAGLMAEVGLLPAPSLGPRLHATFERGVWSVDVGGAFLLSRHAELRSGESATIHWFGGQLAACRSVRGPLRACFGAEAGRIVGTGSGVDEPVTDSGSWLAVTGEASFRGTVAEPFGWELGVGAAAALIRPEFGFDELGVLHRPSSVSGRFFGGVGWR